MTSNEELQAVDNGSIRSTNQHKKKYVNIKINGYVVKFQLDTESDLTILNEYTWIRLGKTSLKFSNMISCGVTGKKKIQIQRRI